MAAYDDTDNTRILHVGVWGFLITFLFVLYANGFYQWFHHRLVEQNTFEFTDSIEILDEQNYELDNFVPLDPEKGRYGLPIQEAMEETIIELKQEPAPATASLN
ncbi:hypothetical protein Pla110_25360 [Polystyrenella longa]|uniref:Uncharacterized protein n=1 Tax=Polystyrenella longa TaxID=2528007 RepID=A0A518CNJ2_9PLAN|nr:hypothetical protein [Polystyrenella longa]QDU80801.1 hypothetical protein Pla110_25360 [Polystyrenella longa]